MIVMNDDTLSCENCWEEERAATAFETEAGRWPYTVIDRGECSICGATQGDEKE